VIAARASGLQRERECRVSSFLFDTNGVTGKTADSESESEPGSGPCSHSVGVCHCQCRSPPVARRRACQVRVWSGSAYAVRVDHFRVFGELEVGRHECQLASASAGSSTRGRAEVPST
jgi:hypothetical protein